MGERAQRGIQLQQQLAARSCIVWSVDVVAERSLLVVTEEDTAPQVPAHVMSDDVDGDPEQPRPDARAATVPVRRSAGLEKRRADDVLDVDVARRSEKPGGEPVEGAAVAIEQRAQGSAVV